LSKFRQEKAIFKNQIQLKSVTFASFYHLNHDRNSIDLKVFKEKSTDG